ncbi:MAG: S8 family serine peptidase [Novosphingobium sp.]
MWQKLPALALALTAMGIGVAAGAHDPETASQAQERLDRDTQRAADRAAEQAQRFAEERVRIEERAVREPAKAAEDLAKLDADRVKEETKIAEDLSKAQEDFTEESAKEAEDAAEAQARAAETDDASNRGSSAEIRDLGQSEGADHDERGFAVRKGELVGIDLAPATIAAAEAKGFRVVERRHLASLDRDVVRLAAPRDTSASQAKTMLHQIDRMAVIDLVHYYGLGLTAGEQGKPVRRGAVAAAAPRAASMTVGLIDTAVARHDALAQSRIIPWTGGASASAPQGHGTAVASLLAREGRAAIFSANIFRGPADHPFTSADVIADALDWMIAQRVPTINMSLAGPRNAILDQLIRDALAGGHMIVAAAGNGGPNAPPAYPAAVPGVVAVTAVDSNQRVYRYANRGRYITVAARGVDVVAANAPGGVARFTGTSFATPHVAAWLALCRAAGSSAAQCSKRLRAAARDLGPAGFDETYGFGYVD